MDNTFDPEGLQPAGQFRQPFAVVGEGSLVTLRQEVNIEACLGDVDPDNSCYGVARLFRVPCLSSGPQVPAIRSGLMEKRGAITL